MECSHPDGVYLYPATDEEGYELVVFRCTECGQKYVEGT
jgi:hypothetical protein